MKGLENYVDVASRIADFVKDFPEGSIKTYMRHWEGPEVIFEAQVYRKPNEVGQGIYTSGWAREIEGKSPVNKTSHIENCETSAIGRALANLGYGTDINRASRSEMIKVDRMQKEHEEMLDFIATHGKKLPDDAEVDGVNVKSEIRNKWEEIQEQFRAARDAVGLIETALGIRFGEDAA